MCPVFLSKYWKNKNERLYQAFAHSYTLQPYRLWRKSPCFTLDRKRIQQTFCRHYHYLPNTPKEQYISYLRLDQTWWQYLVYRNKEQAISMDIWIITIATAFRNTIYHRWYHCWWKTCKRRQSPLKLGISGRHHNHYLWLLTQSYSAILKEAGESHICLVS